MKSLCLILGLLALEACFSPGESHRDRRRLYPPWFQPPFPLQPLPWASGFPPFRLPPSYGPGRLPSTFFPPYYGTGYPFPPSQPNPILSPEYPPMNPVYLTPAPQEQTSSMSYTTVTEKPTTTNTGSTSPTTTAQDTTPAT
uniref:Putative secreted mucin n=1 Tax=Desmodus rotundus TaxID=9430 RepID=K9IGW6_DESRO